MKKYYLITFLIAICSANYQFLIVNMISQVTNGDIFWRNLGLGIVVSSLGLGTFIYEKYRLKISLANVELVLSILGIFSIVFLQIGDGLATIIFNIESHKISNELFNQYSDLPYQIIYDNISIVYKIVYGLFAITPLIIIGIFTGFEFPIIYHKLKKPPSILLALSYSGAVGSAVILVYFLFPILPILHLLLLTSLVNFLIYLYLAEKRKYSIVYILAIVITFTIYPRLVQFTLKNTYIKSANPSLKNSINALDQIGDIQIVKTKYQEAHIFKEKQGKLQYTTVYLNNHFQFSELNEKFYHEGLAHIPRMFHKSEGRTLILGGGDGLLLRELLKYKNEIKHIELDEDFFNFCKQDKLISKLNKNALKSPRVDFTFTDAFTYVKETDSKFEYIYIDFPYPYNYDLLKLYSLEFYNQLYRILSPTGVIVIDVPVHKSSLINDSLNSTMKASKFTFIKFYKVRREGFVILSKQQKEFKMNFDSISALTKADLLQVRQSQFIYKNEKRLINSIFRPTLIDYKDVANKF